MDNEIINKQKAKMMSRLIIGSTLLLINFSIIPRDALASHSGADVTINVTGYLRNQLSAPNAHGRIRVICTNYTSGEPPVFNNNIPFSRANNDPIVVSCVHDLGMTEPLPGDSVRIAIVGDPEFTADPRQISAFVTGLDNITKTNCRNNNTLDLRSIKGTASDVMDCRGIDVGFGFSNIGAVTSAEGRVLIAFNGMVSDPINIICPCFSQNRLEYFPEFSDPNNTPDCTDITDQVGNRVVDANYQSGYHLSVISVTSTPTTITKCSTSSNGVVPILHDFREDLTEEQGQACLQIINEQCPSLEIPL